MNSRLLLLSGVVVLLPSLLHAEPAMIPANRAVGPLRRDPGDGICATVVHVNRRQEDPPQVFVSTADAINKLNLQVGQGMVDAKQGKVFHQARFRNSEATSVGDFTREMAELFPFEEYFAARIRGYVNVSPTNMVYSNAIYAVAGARLRIGGVDLIKFDTGEAVRVVRQVRYGGDGLYPVEVIYYANAGIAVLEASAAPSAEAEGKLGSLDTTKFRLIPPSQMFTSRKGSVTACTECSDDAVCGRSSYCARDWPGGGPGPDGLCQPCLVNDHCGEMCVRCSGSKPICERGQCVECVVDADCPMGRECNTATNTCKEAPPCTTDKDCPSGQMCDTMSGRCFTPCTDMSCTNPMFPKCDPMTRMCAAQCTSDAMCKPDQRCDQAAGLCRPLPSRFVGGPFGCSAAPGGGAGPGALAGLLLLALLALAGRRRRALGVVVASAFFLMVGGRADAQISTNVQTFRPAIGPENIIVVEGTRTPGHLKPMVVGLLEYQKSPLRLIDPMGNLISDTVPNVVTLHLMGGIGVLRWLAFAIDLPIVVYQGFHATTGVPEPNTAGVGDLRLLGKARILNNTNGGLGLAFVPQLTFPTGKGEDLRGDAAVGIEPRFAVDYRTRGGSIIALNLGFLGRTSDQIVGDMQVSSQFRYGIGGLYALPRNFALLLDLSGGVSIQSVRDGRIYAPTEMHGGFRWVHRTGINVTAGMGGGFTDAVGSPQFRMFASAGWLPVAWDRGRRPPPGQRLISLTIDKSGSGTGRVRSTPAGIDCGKTCSAEFPPGTELVLTAEPDANGTFVSWSGPCSGAQTCVLRLTEPTRVGAEFAHREEPRSSLTVDKSGDGTGMVISEPAGILCGKVCQTSYRIGQDVTLRAMPDPGNWFVGWEGPCSGSGPCTLTMGGPTTLRARFNKRKLEVTEEKIDLKGNVIHFDTAKATIQPYSHILLDEVAAILAQHPTMRLKIEGHTDNRVFRAKGGNKKLSQDRAQAVVDYLVGKAIAAERLSSEGYGETCPIASNKTEEGRARNRRTEFWIVKPGEVPGKACRAKQAPPSPVQRQQQTGSSVPVKIENIPDQ
jgi:MYXO-CTERM domain-containing protein